MTNYWTDQYRLGTGDKRFRRGEDGELYLVCPRCGGGDLKELMTMCQWLCSCGGMVDISDMHELEMARKREKKHLTRR